MTTAQTAPTQTRRYASPLHEQREFAVRHGLIGEEALPPETGEEGSDV